MNGKQIVFILLVALTTGSAKAQQIPINNFYLQNPFVFNPAATGINANLAAYIDYADRWSGIKGAPEIANFGVHGLITSTMGIGVQIETLRRGIFNQTTAELNYYYRVAFQNSQSIAFGISLGVMKNKIDLAQVEVQNLDDPALTSNKFDEALMQNGFGMHYNLKDFNFSFSIPLFYGAQEKELAQTIFSLASYDFYLQEGIWVLTPAVLYRFSTANRHQLDFSFMAQWNKKIWVQAGYRTDGNLFGAIGINVKNLEIGYAYEVIRAEMNFASTGTHQLMLMFQSPFAINKKRPLYSDPKRQDPWK